MCNIGTLCGQCCGGERRGGKGEEEGTQRAYTPFHLSPPDECAHMMHVLPSRSARNKIPANLFVVHFFFAPQKILGLLVVDCHFVDCHTAQLHFVLLLVKIIEPL